MERKCSCGNFFDVRECSGICPECEKDIFNQSTQDNNVSKKPNNLSMKYRLINLDSKEENLCDKVTIDGFEYYFLLEKYKGTRSYFYDKTHNLIMDNVFSGSSDDNIFDIVACTNPNIDIPKVVDEVEKLAEFAYRNNPTDRKNAEYKYNTDVHAPKKRKAFIKGYNKSQETHPFSEENMIDFAEWCQMCKWVFNGNTQTWYSELLIAIFPTTKELLQLWKEQQPKNLYFK